MGIPESLENHRLFKHESANKHVSLLVEIFAQQEVQQWCTSEFWVLLKDCFSEMIEEVSDEDFDAIQEDLTNNYHSLQSFFNDVEATSDIAENLFTIDPMCRRFVERLIGNRVHERPA